MNEEHKVTQQSIAQSMILPSPGNKLSFLEPVLIDTDYCILGVPCQSHFTCLALVCKYAGLELGM